MYPLLVFASGLIAGAVGVRLLKRADLPQNLKAATASGKVGLDRAQSAVREATLSGLSAVESTSARLRAKLAPEPETAAPEAPAAEEPSPRPPRRRPRKAKAARPAADGEA
ncbi:hypothetical protein [Azospirillum sp. TSO22-1]|uniref:hypothetical protein n=1 Tax=Azospirillum sp. TSO22-1 TaxID=716789 RepID=UPI000D60D53D|nr:hypothetical protein [Azospirillum sp. TSO22-1]PWC44240.1 hypothetical protein TSO221_18260 [Azospirillum sp. TSO22-1]